MLFSLIPTFQGIEEQDRYSHPRSMEDAEVQNAEDIQRMGWK
jgi:hypothetical protein